MPKNNKKNLDDFSQVNLTTPRSVSLTYETSSHNFSSIVYAGLELWRGALEKKNYKKKSVDPWQRGNYACLMMKLLHGEEKGVNEDIIISSSLLHSPLILKCSLSHFSGSSIQ